MIGPESRTDTRRGSLSLYRVLELIKEKAPFIKIVLAVICVLLIVTPAALAQDVDAFLQSMKARWDSVETFRCDFVQTKRLELLDDSVTSTGHVAYKRPGRMMVYLDPPDNAIVSVTPGMITFYAPGLKKAKRIYVRTAGMKSSGDYFPGAFVLLIGISSDTDIATLKKEYVITSRGDAAARTLTLTTRKKEVGLTIEKIVMEIQDGYIPLSTTIFESGGNKTSLVFKDYRFNVPIDDAQIGVTIPPDTDIEIIGK